MYSLIHCVRRMETERRTEDRERRTTLRSFQQNSAVLALVVILVCGFHIVSPAVDAERADGGARDITTSEVGLPSALQSAGCFGVRTQIPGVDGASPRLLSTMSEESTWRIRV